MKTREVLSQFKDGTITRQQALEQLRASRLSQRLPLSEGQKGLWALQQLVPDRTDYNVSICVRVRRALNIDTLRRACEAVSMRFPILRSVIAQDDGVPYRRVDASVGTQCDFESIQDLDADAVFGRLRELSKRRIDLRTGPLWRVNLFSSSPTEHVVLIVVHHIIFDGGSTSTFLSALIEAYEALESGELPLPRPDFDMYSQFVEWERAMLAGDVGRAHRDYWLSKLSAAPAVLRLPSQRSRPAHLLPDGRTYTVHWSEGLCERLRDVARDLAVTPAVVCLAVYKWVLHRYTGETEIVIGMPVEGRPDERFQATVGYFVNTTAVRTRVNGEATFAELAAQLQSNLGEALDHAAYPFPCVVRDLRVKRDHDAAPIVQIAFGYQSAKVMWSQYLRARRGDGWFYESVDGIQQEGEFEFGVEFTEHQDALDVKFKYDAHRIDQAAVERIAGHFLCALSQALADPRRALASYSFLTVEEIRTLDRWNATESEYPKDRGVHELISDQAKSMPHSTAYSFETSTLSYCELDRRSDRLAAGLKARGVRSGDLVGVCVERSLDLPISLLGVLKAGAAYVPLDPTYPAERLRHMVFDSGVRLIVTQSRLLARCVGWKDEATDSILVDELADAGLSDEASVEDSAAFDWRAGRSTADALAYVMYTSGSTGRPKGVMIAHRALVNFLVAMLRTPGLAPTDKLLAITTYSFDIAALELYLPLLAGAECRICTEHVVKDARLLKEEIERQRPSIMQATPTVWSTLLELGFSNANGMKVLCGGEAMPAKLRRHFATSKWNAWNLYGPTETTVWSTSLSVVDSAGNSIGAPIANTKVHILDRYGEPTPIGVPGELCIAGDGLAQGYWNQVQLTNEKFVSCQASADHKMYRTGDTACWREDGTIEYLGRYDDQVKIRGHRIELGEIEARLEQHPTVPRCAIVQNDRDERRYLVACCELQGAVGMTPHILPASLGRTLAEHLRTTLPEAMIPAKFVAVAKLPLTLNGKVDRHELANVVRKLESTAVRVAERSPAQGVNADTEQRLKLMWSRALNVSEIEFDTGFFDQGGDSVLAVILASRIEKEFGVPFGVTEIFHLGTLRRVADHIGRAAVSIADRAALTGSSRETPSDTSQPRAEPATDPQSVAIIGISCQFPGAANHREFWCNLLEGVEGIELLAPPALQALGVPEAMIADPRFVPAQAAIAGKDLFDMDFFKVSPRDAELMSPHLRLLLQHAWAAVEDAGYAAHAISDTSVLITSNSLAAIEPSADNRYLSWLLGQSGTIPTMISHRLGFKGPSLAVHSNCSSSLVAVGAAYRALLAGESRYALVGAASVLPPDNVGYLRIHGSNFSGDGRVKTFDASADGMVGGEGVAVLLLKRAADAMADGDHIYALIRGVATNNDGADKAGYYAPSVSGQAEVICKVLDATKIDPRTIGYVEAHGTGTELGDPIEVAAIGAAYRRHTAETQFCGIGSVKTNIGHTDTAAGLAGLIKVALSLERRELPASLNFTQPNPRLAIENSPFFVVDRRMSWPKGAGPLRAALSSFGIGGTNAHAILEEASRAQLHAQSERTVGPYIVPLSARNSERLQVCVARLLEFLKEELNESVRIQDIAYTLQVGRTCMPSRAAFVVNDIPELIVELRRYVASERTSADECLESDPDADRASQLTNWIETQQWARLAAAWVQRGAVQWEMLYAPGAPFFNAARRISLPTYPFAPIRVGETTVGKAHFANDIPSATASAAYDSRIAVGLSDIPPTHDGDEPNLVHLKLQVARYLRGVLAQAARLDVAKIDTHEPLERYGIDSMMILQINDLLAKKFAGLPKTLLYDYPTLDDLCNHLALEHRDECARLIDRQSLPRVSREEAATLSETRRPFVHERDHGKRERMMRDANVEDGIAIIGLSGRYPGADSIDEFWNNLAAGKDAIRELSDERWKIAGFYEPDVQTAIDQNKSYSKWGGFIDGFADFDPLFFNLNPRDALNIDPQERLFLQASWEVLEDAGYTREMLAKRYNKRVGVFAGVTKTGYDLYGPAYWSRGEHAFPHTSFSSVANRVSYLFDLRGPSMPIDTMCSASLTAIHEACEHLRRDECELAIAGGVNLYLHPSSYVALCAQRMLSRYGACKSFAADCDGFVPGEGVGAVLLKPLSRAMADEDRIYGVIRATSVNHGGKTHGYTVPSPAAQADLIARALANAHVDARSISYIEAHGTGTELGDPIEIAGLTQAFSQYTSDTQYCSIGSVKSSIGHLESAAGIAGLTKVLLQMRHGKLVPSLHSEELNPHIDFANTPFRVQRSLSEWARPLIEVNGEKKEYPRIAGISSFGAGGANAHVIVEEFIASDAALHTVEVTSDLPALIVLSAKSEDRLKEQVSRLRAFVQTSVSTNADLIHMAYTLQVGREPMEHRLALTAVTIGELLEKLTGHLEGKTERGETELCYYGEARKHKETISIFNADDTLQLAIATWVEQGKYTKLLELWVKGLSFDWTRLYGEGSAYARTKPKRISLPTYPFLKERYWIESSHQGDAAGAVIGVLHPLAQRNTSDFQEQRFSLTFSGEECCLTDHVVGGHKVLPGVAYLEMARAAVELSAGLQSAGTLVTLRNVAWVRPVVVSESKEVHIALYCNERDEIEFEIYTENAEEPDEEVIHAQGRAMLMEADSTAAVETVDLLSLRGHCEQSIEVAQCYAAFSALGLEYGPAHRGLTNVQMGTDVDGQQFVLAKVTLPHCVAGTQGQYALHPSVLDSALQASIGFSLATGAQLNEEASKASLPFALETLQILDRSPTVAMVVVRPCKTSRAAPTMNRIRKLDVDICDESGRVCVRFQGFTSRVLETDLGRPSGVIQADRPMLLTPKWEVTPLLAAAVASSVEYGGRWVFVDPVYKECVSELSALSPAIKWSVLPGDGSAVDRLLAAGEQVFSQVQSMLQGKPKQAVLLQVLLCAEAEHSEVTGALSGLLKSASQEHPKFSGQVLLLSRTATVAELSRAVEENATAAAKGDAEIRYLNGVREVPRLKELTEAVTTLSLMPWKDGGVYLITGGGGGLGLIVAREIANRVTAAKVILTGRSPIGATTQAAVQALKDLGNETHIEYRVLDVTDAAAVAACVRAVVEQHGSINGVVHSAGVIKDNFIIKKTPEEFRAVLAPKVAGTVNVDQATQDVELDFLILFSSLAGAFGNVGQSDYALANAFMDGYAAFRNRLVLQGKRHGKMLSINWPLWADGGMRVDLAVVERMRRQGLNTLTTTAGIDALYRAWRSDALQVVVLAGLRQSLQLQLGMATQSAAILTEPTATSTDLPSNRASVDKGELQDKALQYLKKLLSGALKLPAERIDSDVGLERYGIDSILALKLVSELEIPFGSLPKTLLFEYQSIAALAEYFIERHRGALIAQLRLTDRSTATARPPMRAAAKTAATASGGHRRRRERFALQARSSGGPIQTDAVVDIAIVGLSGRYPGASNTDELWENLKAGKDCITEIPAERWDYREYFDPEKGKAGKSYSKWGGFIEGVDQFDSLFFNISPREAIGMDPQERIFLQCVYQTLEDAGYTREALKSYGANGLDGNVGVFVGVMYEEYQLYGAQAQALGQPYALPGNPSSIANRVSHFCNFHGPSMAVDTMCSSSLTAIHLACQSIKHRGCEIAIAGGVNVSVHPNKYLALSHGLFASSTGRCVSFGKGGDGYVPSEGVGAVLLKPLGKAIADHDHIYGVIKGTSINHGGKTNGYTVPNPQAQAQVISMALQDAKIDARTVSYIEAHGTGTSLGDPIEIAGLTRAFEYHTPEKQYCAIGSAKSNIGHLESAAGIAGLTKVLLQMRHGQLAPSLHSEELNPHIDFASTPFVVQRELGEWRRPVVEIGGETREYPRRAGISAFGAGGSNAHVIVEEYREVARGEVRTRVSADQPALIVLSAKTDEQLRELVQRLLARISGDDLSEEDVPHIAYTLQMGRESFPCRLGFAANSLGELRKQLRAAAVEPSVLDSAQRVYRGRVAEFPVSDTPPLLANDPIQPHHYEQVIARWVQGSSIDWPGVWKSMHGDAKPRRIPLPGYPFARERIWLPMTTRARGVYGSQVALTEASSAAATNDFVDRLFDELLRDECSVSDAASRLRDVLKI